MSEEQKKQLEQQLWNIANTLRGKMDADEFRDYILGFKGLSLDTVRCPLKSNTAGKKDLGGLIDDQKIKNNLP